VLCQSNQIRLTDTRNDFNALEAEIKMPLHHFKSEKQRVVDSFERSYIQRMLKMTQGNLSEAAKRAGMDRKNFWQKVQRHNVMKITSSDRS
jgi:DNA-binding NtrC family response regulator